MHTERVSGGRFHTRELVTRARVTAVARPHLCHASKCDLWVTAPQCCTAMNVWSRSHRSARAASRSLSQQQQQQPQGT